MIAPLRKPTEIWRSWCRRRDPSKEFPYISFVASFCMMHTLDMLYDIDFIDLEAQDDPRITDWRPLGDKDHGPWKLIKDVDLKPLYWLPFVQRHYFHNIRELR